MLTVACVLKAKEVHWGRHDGILKLAVDYTLTFILSLSGFERAQLIVLLQRRCEMGTEAKLSEVRRKGPEGTPPIFLFSLVTIYRTDSCSFSGFV